MPARDAAQHGEPGVQREACQPIQHFGIDKIPFHFFRHNRLDLVN